ncbi:MAG: helix-turn-helix domain-containing protein [Verrucomicrobiales bacterium]|nr:helix-turn-helix domain-containing protein [Verrucomicrobiota bacterium JB025]
MSEHVQSHRIVCNDVAEYSSCMAGPWELEFDQFSAGPGTACNRGVSIGSDVVFEESISWAGAIRGSVGKGMMVISIPCGDPAGIKWWGRTMSEHAMPLGIRQGEVDLVFSGFRQVLAAVSEDEFHRHFLRASGEEAEFLQDGVQEILLPPGKLDELRVMFGRVMDSAECLPAGFSVCRELAEQLAGCGVGVGRQQAPARRRYVREALGMWRESNYLLSVGEICGLLGISQRTLEHAFREFCGTTPYHFLKYHRMNLAHRELLEADPARASVTEIATCRGFFELGRFAVEHRKFFGESPSETLRRKSEARRVMRYFHA